MIAKAEGALADWLASFAIARRHAELPKGDGLVLAERDGVSLGLLADAEEIVIGAGYRADADPDAASLLEAYCRSVIGLPLREAAEHGATRLLGTARAAGAVGAGDGILLPANAEDPFPLLQELCMKLWDAGTEDPNEFHQSPSADWLALSDDQRIASLKAAIGAFLSAEGQPGDVVQLAALEHDLDGFPVRVTVDFGFGLDPALKPDIVRRLESNLKSGIDRSLQVYVVERRDESKLRRL
jgi:hypothetical protein